MPGGGEEDDESEDGSVATPSDLPPAPERAWKDASEVDGFANEIGSEELRQLGIPPGSPASRAIIALNQRVRRLQDEVRLLQFKDATATFDSTSTDVDARLYIESEDAVVALRVFAALQGLVQDSRATSIAIEVVESGSVFLRLRVRMRALFGSRQARVIADELRQAGEAMTVDKAHAENTATIANAAARLIEASKDAGSVALDLGHLVYVQVREPDGSVRILARSRAAREVAESRVADELLRDPMRMIETLDSGEVA